MTMMPVAKSPERRSQADTHGRETKGFYLINPAFLQEIKDSNPDLWDTVHRLRQCCEGRDDTSIQARQLVRWLDELRDQLAIQFALEEAYGFIQVATPVNTVTDAAANEALQEHCRLYIQLSELTERAEELQYRGFGVQGIRELVAKTQAFDAALRAHESHENRLIEDALT